MDIESAKITKACPKCGKEFTKTVRWLQSHDEFPCPGRCGTVIKTKQFKAAVADVKKQLAEFLRKLPKSL